MEYCKSEAIVLASRRYSETSLTVVLLTPQFGRLDVLAKGARREKSPFFGQLDLYQTIEVLFSPRRNAGLDLLLDTSPQDEHTGLRFCPPALGAAGLLAEFAAAVCPRGAPQEGVFSVLDSALGLLARMGEPAARAGLARQAIGRQDKHFLVGSTLMSALLNMFTHLGLGLRLDSCAICGAPAGQGCALSLRRGGLVCRACRPRVRDAAGIGLSALQCLRRGIPGQAELALAPAEQRRLLSWLAEYARRAAGKPLRSPRVFFALY